MSARATFYLALVGFISLITASLSWQVFIDLQHHREITYNEALTHINKNLAFRLWSSSHGGVYVPVTERTPPNPYLPKDLPERDLVTPSGRKLTLMNPAYILRQVMEDYKDQFGVEGRITSKKYLNPKNAPDSWEEAALTLMEGGLQNEVSEIQIKDNKKFLRFMKAMKTEASCLKCHQQQGYKVGDIRGGISISLPLAKHDAEAKESLLLILSTHVFFCLIGVSLIILSYRRRVKAETEKSEKMLSLENSEKIFRVFFEQSPAMMFVLNENSHIINVNQQALTTLGYKFDDLCFQPLTLITGIETALKFQEQSLKAFAMDNTKLKMSAVLLSNLGFEINVLMEIAKIPSVANEDGGALQGEWYILVCEDITEQVRLTQKLEYARDLAEKASKAKDYFLANINHDIRTPLGAVQGMLGLLVERENDPKKLRWLKTAKRASDVITELVRTSLDISRLESGHIELKLEPTMIEPLCSDIQNLMSYYLEKKSNTLEFKLFEDCPKWIVTDKNRLLQILTNLVMNSCKYTDGGSIVVEFAAFKDHHLQIRVKDTGVGISQEKLAQLFTAFVRDKRVQHIEGIGLGLTICKHLCNLMYGEIWAESEVNMGTTFYLNLPIELLPKKESGLPSIQQKKMILYYSYDTQKSHDKNDPDIQKELEWIQYLREKYQVAVFNSLAFALESFRTKKFEMVIIDLDSSQEEGLALLRHVRSVGSIPCVGLTSKTPLVEEASDFAELNARLPRTSDKGEILRLVDKLIAQG